MKTRKHTKHTIKTVKHTVKYPFGADKTEKTLETTINIIHHTYEAYKTSSTGVTGYTPVKETLIQTEDKKYSMTASEETLKSGALDDSIITALTGTYYNDNQKTYFKSLKDII